MRCFCIAIALLFFGAGAAEAEGKTNVTWYGHAAFRIDTPNGTVILIDPWITNPANPDGKAELAQLTRVDLILATHGKFDHVGAAPAVAKATKAKLVATVDLGHAIVGTMAH